MIRTRMTCLLAIISVVMLSGCASIVSKSTYDVQINSSPQGAQIEVLDSEGKPAGTGYTPVTVSLKAGAGYFRGQKYTVTFEKPGFDTQTVPIRRGVDGWYAVGNLFFGGLIGYLIVDPLTGAMWTLKDLNVVLTPSTTSFLDKPGLHLLTIDSVPQHLRSRMVRLN